ncbi:MAG: hypothetical protein HOC33_00465 [Alphaproteobacteria bacterium]|nr:hypothetical protein [Alphaproteobacteria bacterium]MBT4084361.1 hypothetical protein [Alphaproteobacteria bacterium]MBT4542286.1 hypothetical protein [Alphaproteobacteria bacterium]
MTAPKLSPDGTTMTVRVPMKFQVRGGRKLVVTPDGSPSWAKPRKRIDNAMVKALARAFRWQKLLDDSTYTTIEDIANSEKINPSYVSRVLRLTLLSPEIVEMILDGRQSLSLTMKELLIGFPLEWGLQKSKLIKL